jgi:hypothetical protein
MSMFDTVDFTLPKGDDSGSDSDSSEDNIPLSILAERLKDKPILKRWYMVENEGKELKGQEYITRTYKFRDRANEIFDWEKKAIMNNTKVSAKHKQNLEEYTLIFDRGTKRRGVCHYPFKGRRGWIGLSARMVDGGAPAESIAKVIRHELSHACNPGMKHNKVWKAFDVLIGGDGKRCCVDEEIKQIIGHRIEVFCPNGVSHYLKKMQKRPSAKWLNSRCCKTCHSRFSVRWAVQNKT